jgi:hypothetical protein
VAELKFRRIGDVPAIEVKAQQQDDRRVSVWLRTLERDKVTVIYTNYDPDMILERHGHSSDNLVYVMEGDLGVGLADGTERSCPAGTLITLEKGAVFGPLVAGPEGCLLFETWGDDVTPVPADKDGYHRLLAAQGIERLPNPPFERPAGAPEGDLGIGDRWS